MTSSAINEWLCPVCGRYFGNDGTCPNHGTALIRAPRPRTPSPSAALPTFPMRTGPAIWILLAAGVIVLSAIAIWSARTGRQTPHQPRREAITAPPRATPARTLSALSVEPATPAAPGVTEDEILFGMAAPLSGPAKELGREMKMGIEAAFSAANDAGGIAGRRLRLTVSDDGYEPARTIEAMKDLRDRQKVFGFVGNVGTPTAAVALPLALERRMLFFGAFTGASLLRRDPPDRYVFNFRASYAEETAAAVRYLVKVRHLRPESIVVFAQQDAFGDTGYAGVIKAMRELRPDVRSILRVGYQRNTADVAEAVARLRARSAPVRAVVMVATYRAAARFVEKVRDLYPRMIFTNISFVGSTALADELNLLGQHYATGVIVTQVVPPVESFSTAVLKYKEALGRYFPGEKIDYVSLEGFWAANVLIEGLRRADRKLNTERLVDALEGIHELDLGLGTPLSFGLTEHQASHRVWGTQINDSGVYDVIELE
jgi:ABC-type branched-subunit amino acid transport system substrate-binding protein